MWFLIIFSLVFFILLCKNYDVYGLIINLYAKKLTYGSHKWYILILLNILSLFSTVVMCFLILNIIPAQKTILQFTGKDTMPLYASHALVYIIMPKILLIFGASDNLKIVCWIVAIPICVLLFESSGYVKLFNNVFLAINHLVIRSNKEMEEKVRV